MGGPPAHELYRDLVSHGGMHLLRDRDGSPWVEIQDGERRRTFRVPGLALRGALDRFRMRRNLRPVPESDLEDFARVVAARVSDPDVRLPLFDPPAEDPAFSVPSGPTSPALDPPTAPAADPVEVPDSTRLEAELRRVMREVDEVRSTDGMTPTESRIPAPWVETPELRDPFAPRTAPVNPALSGAQRETSVVEDDLPRYLRVLRGLAAGGGWIGTLGELGRLTRADPDAVFGSLLKYHNQLTQNHLVVAPVEVEDGWRWLVVDRSRLRTSGENGAEADEPARLDAPEPSAFSS